MAMNEENISPANAVSIYGQNDAMDDFPVLKAFQQYIDNEQEKARKRMMGLGFLFAFVLVSVIAVFAIMMNSINRRNQELSEKHQELSNRLLEYAMKERDRAPVVVTPPTNGSDAALKAVTESLVALQKEILEQKKQQTAVEAARNPSAVDAEYEKVIRDEAEKMKRARALLRAEQEQLAAEKERLHREEVERQRRRLYPEYYENEDRQALPPQPQANPLPRPQQPAPKPSVQPPAQEKPSIPADAIDPSKVDEDNAIDYFSDYYEVPVDVNGKSSNWQIPLD